MAIIIVLIAIALLVIFLAWLFGGNFFLKKHLDESYIIFGPKGSGKTSLCSWFASQYSKKAVKGSSKFSGYVSNTDFHFPNGFLADCGIVNCKPNTWQNVLDGNIIPITKNPLLESKAVILDDSAIYLPNFADSLLKKKYDSMPVAFALWRHMYNAPILINSQDLDRTWKMLREQQTAYIWCRGVKRIFGIMIISFIYYDRYNSASNRLLPLDHAIFNKYSTADVNQYKATNGTIKRHFVLTKCKYHTFNSRYFHNVLFGSKPPKAMTKAESVKAKIKNCLGELKSKLKKYHRKPTK